MEEERRVLGGHDKLLKEKRVETLWSPSNKNLRRNVASVHRSNTKCVEVDPSIGSKT
jgi:hypothetical protein